LLLNCGLSMPDRSFFSCKIPLICNSALVVSC